jgi:hypothetical protein
MFLDFCKDYQVKIKTKNLCVPNCSNETVLDFQRSLCTNISLNFINNVILINHYINNCLVIKTSCADTYDIEIKNRNGKTVYSSSGNIISDPQCIWYPNPNLAQAVYYYVLKLDNCSGDHSESNGIITLMPSSSNMPNPNAGENMSMQVFPNPFNKQIVISLDLPTKTSSSTIEIYNSSGILIDNIIVNKNINAGLHSYTYSTINLSSGLYFIKFLSSDYVSTCKIVKQ